MIESILVILINFLNCELGPLAARVTVYYQISDFDRRMIQVIYTLAMLIWDFFTFPTAGSGVGFAGV